MSFLQDFFPIENGVTPQRLGRLLFASESNMDNCSTCRDFCKHCQMSDPLFHPRGDEKRVCYRQRGAGFRVGSEKASFRPSKNPDGRKPSIRRSEDRQRDS